jgi:hypothetical protein
MHEPRATVVSRAARACLQKEKAVWAKGMLVVAVAAVVGARARLTVPVKDWAKDLNIIVRRRKKRCLSIHGIKRGV